MINCFREASPSSCFLEQEGCLLHQPSQVGRVRGVCMGGRIALGKVVLSVVMATVARCHQEPTLEVDLPNKKAEL